MEELEYWKTTPVHNTNEVSSRYSSSSTIQMSSTIDTITLLSGDTTKYSIVVPLSISFAILACIICCVILELIIYSRRLHTVNHLLIGNTCVWSIFYCFAQSNHFIYLLFIPWDRSDMSCRWRGFFVYLTITGMIYSFFIHAISRSFFIVLVHKYRWIISFKVHYILICIQWILVILLNLPSIVTKDIYFRPHALCWVTRSTPMHNNYTFIAYYAVPTVLIIVIYIHTYCRVKHSTNQTFARQGRNRQQNRDFEVFRNIMILFGIYLCGGIPTAIYMLINVDIFYWIGIVVVSVAVAVEKFVTFYLDRELLNVLKKRIRQKPRRTVPVIS